MSSIRERLSTRSSRRMALRPRKFGVPYIDDSKDIGNRTRSRSPRSHEKADNDSKQQKKEKKCYYKVSVIRNQAKSSAVRWWKVCATKTEANEFISETAKSLNDQVDNFFWFTELVWLDDEEYKHERTVSHGDSVYDVLS